MTDYSQWDILLVDDEPDSLKLIHDILELNGATVYRAESGAECLDFLTKMIPTLLVVDLAMPSPDGWEILAEIRGTPNLAKLPVIAVTAYDSREVANEAYNAGFNGFLGKPVKSSALMEELSRIMA